jgi:hypothetical protein
MNPAMSIIATVVLAVSAQWVLTSAHYRVKFGGTQGQTRGLRSDRHR